jgi:hypothetical protein
MLYFECPECDCYIDNQFYIEENLEYDKNGYPVCPDCGGMGNVTEDGTKAPEGV